MSEYQRYALKYNPFEPSASGLPIAANDDVWLPDSWKNKVDVLLKVATQARGTKAIAIVGEYGSGKSYILQWLLRDYFPAMKIRPFYFQDPGVQFYGLANAFLADVGRKNFSRSLWELAGQYVENKFTRNMFLDGYEEYLRGQAKGLPVENVANDLQQAIIAAGVTKDEDVAHRLALIVVETPRKPYFEYREFLAGKPGALVSENKEIAYFVALLRTLRLTTDTSAVAFLIDEFEEISLQKQINSRAAHDYLATMKRLISLMKEEDLWVVVGMHPDAIKKTQELEPALNERFLSRGDLEFTIPALGRDDATELVRHRLASARVEELALSSELFPFPDDFVKYLKPKLYSSPRKLVQFGFYALSRADGESLPFSESYLHSVASSMVAQSDNEED